MAKEKILVTILSKETLIPLVEKMSDEAMLHRKWPDDLDSDMRTAMRSAYKLGALDLLEKILVGHVVVVGKAGGKE